MDNIIPFPIDDLNSLQEILSSVKSTYIKAGLSEESANTAIDELEPILEQFMFGRREFSMDIPSVCGLTKDQENIVREAHNDCIQEVFDFFQQEIGRAVCIIAGLVGSKYNT